MFHKKAVEPQSNGGSVCKNYLFILLNVDLAISTGQAGPAGAMALDVSTTAAGSVKAMSLASSEAGWKGVWAAEGYWWGNAL